MNVACAAAVVLQVAEKKKMWNLRTRLERLGAVKWQRTEDDKISHGV